MSGWEEDSGTEGVKGRKRYLLSLPDNKADTLNILIFSVPSKASTVFDGDDEDVVFMEDLATRWAWSSYIPLEHS